jgi:hypothetical protein
MRSCSRSPLASRALAAAPLLLALAVGMAAASPVAAGPLNVFDEHGDEELDPLLGETCVESGCGNRCQQILDRARRATASYLDDAAALERGYVADPICVAVPGVGGMGIHYISQARMTDGKIDPRLPEILLYEDRPNGERWLIAVEYFMPVFSNGQPWMGGANEPPPTVDNAAPVLFGRVFDGPMPGHAPGMPWHYDLHVWVWKHNPAGIFAQFNPTVSCN